MRVAQDRSDLVQTKFVQILDGLRPEATEGSEELKTPLLDHSRESIRQRVEKLLAQAVA